MGNAAVVLWASLNLSERTQYGGMFRHVLSTYLRFKYFGSIESVQELAPFDALEWRSFDIRALLATYHDLLVCETCILLNPFCL